MRHPKLAALTVALTAVLVMPVAQCVAQPFPFDPGSFGNGSTGSLGSDDPDIPIENTLPQLSVTTLVDGLDHPWDVAAAPGGAILAGQRSGGFFVRRSGNTTGPVSAFGSLRAVRNRTHGHRACSRLRSVAHPVHLPGIQCRGSHGRSSDLVDRRRRMDRTHANRNRTARDPGLVRASWWVPNSCGPGRNAVRRNG